MSAEIGRIKGRSHPISVSTSSGGVELQMWEDATNYFGDSITPQCARGLAALLVCAAEQHEKMISDKVNR